MKILNFICTVIIITATTFLHTHQKIEALRFSYEMRGKEAVVNNLLDQQKELEYNVARLKAPGNLELQLAKNDVKMVLPERWQVFKVSGLKEKETISSMPLFVRNFVDLFSLNSAAQATPAAK